MRIRPHPWWARRKRALALPCAAHPEHIAIASLAAVDLEAHHRDGALIDAGRVPGLDGGEIRLAWLIACARAPAMRLEKTRGRVQRVGRDLEIAGAVGQDVLRQKLGLADLAVHGAAGGGRKHAAIDQLQRRVKLLGEIFRPPAVIGERRDRGEHVLVAALAAEAGFHSPDREQRPRRHAVALLDRSKQRALRLLQAAPARDNAGGPALGEKRFERERKTALAAIGVDGCAGIVRPHQRRDARGADALGASLLGGLLLPGLEPAWPIAAWRGVRAWGRKRE